MKLIFVYNAESGKLNALLDIAHKVIKPETYQCFLCALTHDALSEKKAWSDFKAKTNWNWNSCTRTSSENNMRKLAITL